MKQLFVDLPIPPPSLLPQCTHPNFTPVVDLIDPSYLPKHHTPLLPSNNTHGMVTHAKLRQDPSLALHVSNLLLLNLKILN